MPRTPTREALGASGDSWAYRELNVLSVNAKWGVKVLKCG
jgi:hypothetical protein